MNLHRNNNLRNLQGRSKDDEKAVVIVLYHPEVDSLSYFRELANSVDRLILVDNTPSEAINYPWPKQVDYISNGENLGIAKALNQGIEKLLKEGYKFVFLFDQDSRVKDDFFEKMLIFKCMNTQGVAIWAPDFLDINTGMRSRFTKLGRWTYRSLSCEGNQSPIVVSFVITSGSLLDLYTWEMLGRFREDFFIDHVDSEYCLRVAVHGFSILVNPNVVLQHAVGKRSVHKLFGQVIKPNHHNYIRRYYISRNGVCVLIQYGKLIHSVIPLYLARMMHDILGIVFFERERIGKLKATLYGALDAFKGKMGPMG